MSASDDADVAEGTNAVMAGMSSEEPGRGVLREGDDQGHSEGRHVAENDSELPGDAVVVSGTAAVDGADIAEGANAVTAGMSSAEPGRGVLREGDDQGHSEGHHAAGHDSELPGEAVVVSETALNEGSNDNNLASAESVGPLGEVGHEALAGTSGPWVEDESDPYYVPEAWRRVLRAWNEDVAVGAGVEDSGLSVGNFEHTQGIVSYEHEDSGLASTTVPATSSGSASAESSGSVSGRRSGTGADTDAARGGQTTLKGG